MASSTRTTGIIVLADKQEESNFDWDPQDLAAAMRWLVRDPVDDGETQTAAKPRFARDFANCPQSATSIRLGADLDAIYSQLEDEYQRLLAC